MDAEVAVVGGGVVGLACAAALARRGHGVFLLERRDEVGEETSSRNSEVIHAGLYYPPGSLKATRCVRGRELLYAHCQRAGIAHAKLGKLVVATEPSQLPALRELQARGLQNGAGALAWLDADAARALEPRVRCVAALLSPESGIVDSHGLLVDLRRQAVERGTDLALRTRVVACEPRKAGWRLDCEGPRGERESLSVGRVINAAGLGADAVAAACGVDVRGRDLWQKPCRGDYFMLSGRLRGAVERLIYPLPDEAGLGIHLTLDLAGALRAGPDAHYVPEVAYEVDGASRATFAAAVQRYLPEVTEDDLSPAYAGVRPKLAGPGEGFRDFVVRELPEAPGVLHMLGIESPGLTAALALAEDAVRWVEQGENPAGAPSDQ